MVVHKLTRLYRATVITNKNGRSRAIRYKRAWLYFVIKLAKPDPQIPPKFLQTNQMQPTDISI